MKPDNKKRRKGPRRQDGYFGSWERERVLKAKKLKREFKKIRAWIDRYLKDRPEYRHLKSVMILWIMMKRYGLSIRGMIDELHFRRGALKVVCLKQARSKSWLHKWMRRLPMEMLDDLILFTAGDDACGSFSVDSTHHRFNRYRLVDNSGDERRANQRRRTHMTEAERKATRGKTVGAPPGKRWVSDTCKHHVLTSPNGKVLASVVTDGDTSDSVVFAELCSGIPKGSGNAMGDRAYCSEENCDLAVQVGRDPYFEPKKSYRGNGMSAWAEMVRLWKEHPGRFYKVYKTRSSIEACFSAIKGRFAYCVRSVTLEMQKRELAIVSICRNIHA